MGIVFPIRLNEFQVTKIYNLGRFLWNVSVDFITNWFYRPLQSRVGDIVHFDWKCLSTCHIDTIIVEYPFLLT